MNRHLCTMLVTLALTGCSTGGGGSGGPSGLDSPPPNDSSSSPASFEYPTLAAVTGEVHVESAIPAGQFGYDGLRGRVSATADGAGNFTFRVDDPRIGPYQFTVNLPRNTKIDFSGAQVQGSFASFDYSALGTWQHSPDPNNFVLWGGSAVAGVATRAADLPRTGTASYAGPFLGRYNDDGDPWVVSATARSLANFGTGVVSFETTGTQITDSRNTLSAPQLDLTGSMTFASSGGARQNSLSGSVSTKSGSMTGDVRAVFFGPSSPTSAPPELGGSVALKGGGPEPEGVSLTGSFIMRR